ncbi:Single-stranded DNA-binding protein 2 [Triplophysa tibetana]|uniref:Single-stranded DNA-binding protein 2 n=1 Tax=Triplophysa tibetana TaxID=1572043 RepID=A0A5A9N605_9TELE|nr:Single-stranded DNA-binding protein 2 [Triplophysa tibetana]
MNINIFSIMMLRAAVASHEPESNDGIHKHSSITIFIMQLYCCLNLLALYVYEYLLHVGAQKSAQTFLSEVSEPEVLFKLLLIDVPSRHTPPSGLRLIKLHTDDMLSKQNTLDVQCPLNGIGEESACRYTMGEEHNVRRASRVPTFMVVPFMSSRYPGGPRPPLRIPNQALGGVPGNQPLLPSGMDPLRQQGHPNMGGAMQRMTPPRGMVPLGPQGYGGGMRPPLNALGGPGMPGMNMAPGGRPWPNPPNSNSISYSSASPGSYVGPPGGGGGPPGTPIMPSPADSTNSGENMYTMINTVPPGGNRQNFPLGPGGEGPMGGMSGLESHHMNGSLGSADMDSMSKNSPGTLNMSNQPGTPRDDGEISGNFLNPFQNESYSPNMTMSV